jgi:hypothetical protein
LFAAGSTNSIDSLDSISASFSWLSAENVAVLDDSSYRDDVHLSNIVNGWGWNCAEADVDYVDNRAFEDEGQVF